MKRPQVFLRLPFIFSSVTITPYKQELKCFFSALLCFLCALLCCVRLRLNTISLSFDPDRRLLACSSIGVPPPRLHCGRAANYGSIIVPLRLSLPDRLRSGLCCNGFIALPFASWRACSLAQRLLTSQRRECICLDVYSVVMVL